MFALPSKVFIKFNQLAWTKGTKMKIIQHFMRIYSYQWTDLIGAQFHEIPLMNAIYSKRHILEITLNLQFHCLYRFLTPSLAGCKTDL
jgi:hypothetical protein